MLTHGSLFAGIGGFDLGFERAGIKTIWQVELDPYAQRVLARHFPEAKRYTDIRECCGHRSCDDEFCGKGFQLPYVDILSGGFPCQDVSRANPQGAGLNGARSGLWSEYHRIICELRPQIIIVENVSALLDDGMGRVLRDLASCGYDAEWDCLPASAFGAYHERDRVFILAYAAGDDGQARNLLEAGAVRRSQLQFRRLSGMAMAEAGEQENVRLDSEPRLDRLVDGTPDRLQRDKALGNTVHPAITEWIGRRIVLAERLLEQRAGVGPQLRAGKEG
jgi:DNA (cytosine-5)-methyltransferase 1